MVTFKNFTLIDYEDFPLNYDYMISGRILHRKYTWHVDVYVSESDYIKYLTTGDNGFYCPGVLVSSLPVTNTMKGAIVWCQVISSDYCALITPDLLYEKGDLIAYHSDYILSTPIKNMEY